MQEDSRRGLKLKFLGGGGEEEEEEDFASQALDHPHEHGRYGISMLATMKQMTSLVTERLHSSRPDLRTDSWRLSGRDPVGIHQKSENILMKCSRDTGCTSKWPCIDMSGETDQALEEPKRAMTGAVRSSSSSGGCSKQRW